MGATASIVDVDDIDVATLARSREILAALHLLQLAGLLCPDLCRDIEAHAASMPATRVRFHPADPAHTRRVAGLTRLLSAVDERAWELAADGEEGRGTPAEHAAGLAGLLFTRLVAPAATDDTEDPDGVAASLLRYRIRDLARQLAACGTAPGTSGVLLADLLGGLLTDSHASSTDTLRRLLVDAVMDAARMQDALDRRQPLPVA